MNLDLTICARPGQSRDVSIRAPEGTSVGAVLPELVGPGDDGLWSGPNRVCAAAMLGGPGLRSGCVLSTTAPAPGPELTRGGLEVQVCGGPDAGRRLALGRGLITVGRAPDCDLVLPDPAVSRRHSCLTVTAAGVSVRDLGATHRTLVDTRPIDADGADFPPGAVLRLGDTFLTLGGPAEPPAAVRAGPDGTRLVNRAPRTTGTAVRAREIELPVARVGSPQRVQWWAAVVPAFAGVLLATLLGSPQFLAFVLLSPMILLGTALGERLQGRRGRRRAVGSLRRQRRAARQQILAALSAEVTERRAAAPAPAAVEDAARMPSIRLWQRRRADPDLLVVRLGLGELPASTRVRTGTESCSAATLAAVPIEFDLRQGTLGIAAPRRVRLGIGRWLVGQLATQCSPADIQLWLLLADDLAPDWTWARWLPHLGGRIARTARQRTDALAELQHLISARVARGRGEQQWNGPWQVLVVDSSACLGGLPELQAVLAAGPAAGVTAVCLESDHARLPQPCSSVARTIGETGSRLELCNTTGPERSVIADQVTAAWAESVARALAPLVDAGAETSAGIPDSARLLDICALPDLDPARIAERWALSDGRAGTLLGLGVTGPVGIDLVTDGPHALIAGTTGSGKSELLQTLIAGLALNHPPDQLSFVLVDYKGGAAFAQCCGLPHTAGLVTDLDAQLTARALSSLECELHRREQLFARTGARSRGVPGRRAGRTVGTARAGG